MYAINAGPTEYKYQKISEIMITFIIRIGATVKYFCLLLAVVAPELPAFPSSLNAPTNQLKFLRVTMLGYWINNIGLRKRLT